MTSKRVLRDALLQSEVVPERATKVLDALLATRLVRLTRGETTDDDQVEVAHEALVRNWPRLMGWLEEQRAALILRRRFEMKAEEWVQHGRSSAGLLDEVALGDLERWIRDMDAVGLGFQPDLRELAETSKRRALIVAAEDWQARGQDLNALWKGSQLRDAVLLKNPSRLERNFLVASLSAEEAATRVREEIERAQDRARQREVALLKALYAEEQRRAEAERLRSTEQLRLIEAERQQSEERTEANRQRAEERANAERLRAEERARAVRRLSYVLVVLAIVSLLVVGASIAAFSSRQAAVEQRQTAQRAAAGLQTEVVVRTAAEGQAIVARGMAQAATVTAQIAAIAAVAQQGTAQAEATRASANEQTAKTAQALAGANASNAQIAEVVARNNEAAARNAEATARSAETAAIADRDTAVAAAHGAQVEIAQRIAAEDELRKAQNELSTQASLLANQLSAQEQLIATQQAQARQKEAQALALRVPELVDGKQPQLALLVAIEAAQRLESKDTEDALQQSIQALLPNLSLGRNISGATWSPDSRYIIVGQSDGIAFIWDTNTADTSRPIQGPGSPLRGPTAAVISAAITSAAWSSDGSAIVTTSANPDNAARIWPFPSGSFVRSLQHPDAVTGAAWSPDDTLLLTTCADGFVRLWNVASGQRLREWTSIGDRATRSAWSPDRRYFVTASGAGGARVWDVNTGRSTQLLHGGTSVRSAAWQPNGNAIVTAASDGKVRIWQPDGTLLKTLSSNASAVNSVVNSAEWTQSGNSIVSAGADGTAHVWRSSDGVELSVLRGQSGPLISAAWSPDTRRIVTAGADGTVRLYYVEFPDILRQAQALRVLIPRPDLTNQELQDIANGVIPTAAPSPTLTPTPAPP